MKGDSSFPTLNTVDWEYVDWTASSGDTRDDRYALNMGTTWPTEWPVLRHWVELG